MDNTNQLKQDAYTAASNVNNMQTSAPGLLQELKQNLVGIFAKDNPIIDARNNSLAGYLATANNTRAEMLPGNMPTVEGRPLALSPTQQDAIVGGRNAAALAPLAGYNEILKAMYGGIGDMVGNAGDIYSAQIQGAQGNAQNLLELYKAAIEEEKARNSAAGSGGIDLASILAAISGQLNVGAPKTGPSLDDIFGAPAPNAPNTSMDPSSWSIAPSAGQKTISAVGVPDVTTAANSNINELLKRIKGTPATTKNNNKLGIVGNQTSPFGGLGLNFNF